MSDTILHFSNASLQRAGNLLINDITFKVLKGEHLAIVGPAGSGKSSLLDAIGRKSYLGGGAVSHPLFEQIMAEKHEDPMFSFKYFIALVPSKHSFNDLTNTSSNLYYQQRYNSADSDTVEMVGSHLQRVQSEHEPGSWTLDRLEERLNLRSLHQKQLIKLSNGETKRLLLASALIKNPRLLLLDNPLTGLDPTTRSGFNDLLIELADSGITIIMTTSPGEIPEIMTHVAVIQDKKLHYLEKREFNPALLIHRDALKPNESKIKELVPNLSVDSPAIFDIKKVTIRYDDNIILDDVSWKVNAGERWLLKGHNGAGKSTLLSLVNADNPQSYAHDISLFGKMRGTGESIWDIKGKIGFVSAELFQYFPGHSTCSRVIESGFYDTMGLFRPSNPEKLKTAISWMELLGIGDYKQKLFKSVPESIQRLCLLARAMVKRPPLLILDEPCQGLDVDQQAVFKNIIEAICLATEITLIYVSHFQEEVPDSLTHVLELSGGKVILNSEL